MAKLMRFGAGWSWIAVLSSCAQVGAPLVSEETPQSFLPLARAIEAELADKAIPALSVALVDRGRTVWSAGFGLADPHSKRPALSGTVYRVGSVSKLFTDLALMRLWEEGKVDLDSPIEKYLPELRPSNPFSKPFTLRQLMAHRAGLVRETPRGSYFDPVAPDLERTVLSLNETTLVHEPGTKTKYSNAGIAVVGLVLERLSRKSFEQAVRESVLEPLRLERADFALTDAVRTHLAHAVMGTPQGRDFPAPVFQLGTSSAGNLYASMEDLARFLACLMNGGKVGTTQLVKRETLEEMWRVQFPEKDPRRGIGLGFFVDEIDGRRRVGHNGAVYGFATELALLPDEGLGLAMCASRDVSNDVVHRLADFALRLLRARREGTKPPEYVPPRKLSRDEAQALVGHYRGEKRAVDITLRGEALEPCLVLDGVPRGLRRVGDKTVIDDALGRGGEVDRLDDARIRFAGQVLSRAEPPRPPPAPERWRDVIGEYGWDHNVLYLHERDGTMWALIEWFFPYPLEELAEGVFRFPSWGLYSDERILVKRGLNPELRGRVEHVEAASVSFPRREPGAKDGEPFRIQPLRPVEELRAASKNAQQPKQKGEFAAGDLVELVKLDPGLRLDVRYATEKNFLGVPLYPEARAFLQRPAAEALGRVQAALKKDGFGLLIHDAYRPWSITWMFWEATPAPMRGFVANPEKGSRHNRGAAVDLTLFDERGDRVVAMPSGYDEFSDRAFPLYPGGTSLERWHRELLRRAMEKEGFSVYEMEWWHFDFNGWEKWAVENAPFDSLGR